jgi:hypothetical protein
MSGIMSMLLGAVSSAITDVYFNLVTLLLPGNGTNGAQNNTFLDSSTNNFTITRNGNTTQGTFSPFSQTGWSNYFGGDGNYLSTAYSADFSFSTGEFSIECWAYVQDAGRTADANKYGALISQAVAASTTNQWQFLIRIVSGVITEVVLEVNGASALSVTGQSISINAWHHFVLCRSGTTLSIFVDGTRIGTITYSTAINSNTSGTLQIARNAYANTYQNWLSGYISNVRILNGTSAYSASVSTFTVPASPITDVTNTKLLTCQSNRFIDANTQVTAKTITITGTPSVQAFEPFAPGVAYSAATVGGSGYFDGTGDNLVAPNNTALAMGTGDFQIEFWAYHTSIPAGFTYIDTRPTGTNGSYITLGYNNSGNGIFLYVNTMLISTGITPVANSWTHFVLSRVGSTTRLFRNGSQIGSATDGTNYAIGAQGMGIGANTIAADNYFPGYISEFRVVKGSGVTSVTVPTAPLTAITNTVLLLNFTNAGITDATAKNVLETVGNAQISTTQSKFGGSSMYFDGTGDYLKFPSSELVPFASNEKFTIEGWIYPSAATAGQIYGIYTTRNSGISAYAIAITLFGSPLKINVEIATSGSSLVTISSSTTISANTWYHFAVVHDGTQLKLYLNGTSEGTPATTSQATTLKVMALGRYYVDIDNYYFNGYIDDFRITKGYARYTSNFTPPTAAYALQ